MQYTKYVYCITTVSYFSKHFMIFAYLYVLTKEMCHHCILSQDPFTEPEIPVRYHSFVGLEP